MSWVVYQIECVPVGRIYIGVTSDYQRRIQSYFAMLRRGKHPSSAMSIDYGYYGAEGFIAKQISSHRIRAKALLAEERSIRKVESVSLYNSAHKQRARQCNSRKAIVCGISRQDFIVSKVDTLAQIASRKGLHLSEAARLAGIDQSTLSRWRKGEVEPGLFMYQHLHDTISNFRRRPK